MFKKNMVDKKIFSDRLKSLRKERGFATQIDFADAFDKKYYYGDDSSPESSFASIKKWESSKSPCLPDTNRLWALCDFLGCDSDFLLGFQDTPKKEIEKAAGFTGISYDAMKKVSNYKLSEKEVLECLILNNECLQTFLKSLYIGAKETLNVNARELKEIKCIDDLDQLEYHKYMKFYENYIENSGCIYNILNSLLSYKIQNQYIPVDVYKR